MTMQRLTVAGFVLVCAAGYALAKNTPTPIVEIGVGA
jgi:hypothetical protein